MSNKTKHNGWANYETWAVNQWLTNDQHSDSWLREVTRDAIEDARPEGSSEHVQGRAAVHLANRLKEAFIDSIPDLGGSVWADLLNAALGEVDWYEIANHHVGDCLAEEVSK